MAHPLPMNRSSGDKADIRAVMETIRQAHHDKDAAAIVAQYAPGAVVFDLAPPLAREIDRSELAAWLDTWEGPVEVESRDFHITVGGDIAFGHGFHRVSATAKAGGERAVFWIRATLCFSRSGGAWRIVHEHTSVPFYMDGSFRAAIDLEP